MARHLNTNCDFTSGFFVCNIPRDAIQVVLKNKMKWGKHTLTEDWERRTEKYRAMGEAHPMSQDWTNKKGRACIIEKRYMILGPHQTQEHGSQVG